MSRIDEKGGKEEKYKVMEEISIRNSLRFFFFNVYLFLGQRETEHERGRGRERGRHRNGNRLQALSHQPRARRGARTHGPRDRDLAEVGRLTDCATQAPQDFLNICIATTYSLGTKKRKARKYRSWMWGCLGDSVG